MSIPDRIESLVNSGRLHLISPTDPGREIKRTMAVSGEVQKLLDGPWESVWLERRANALRTRQTEL